jgi:hypothetical protein
MFKYPNFEVEIIRRKVDADRLGWPSRGEACDETGLGCNRSYMDLRRLSWTEAERVLALERDLTARVVSAHDPEEEWAAIEDEYYDSDQSLCGLDLGVASRVVCLSAAKCIPFTS